MKILETIGLTKGFDGLIALDRLDFKLEVGEIRAVIGPNGAGKTTFLNLITGQLRSTAGKIFFKREEITGLPPYAIARLGIARTFQITSLFPDLTVCQNIWCAVAVQGVRGRGRGRRWRWLYPSSHLTDVHKRTAEILELATSITVLHYGRFLAEGRPQEIRENRHVQEVYLRGAR